MNVNLVSSSQLSTFLPAFSVFSSLNMLLFSPLDSSHFSLYLTSLHILFSRERIAK